MSVFHTFASLGHGAVTLAPELVSKSRLRQLFAIDDDDEMVLMTADADELQPDEDGHYTLPEGHSRDRPFMVVSGAEIEHGGPLVPRTRAEYVSFMRRRAAMESAKLKLIEEVYKPLHPHIYQLSESFFVPSFLAAIRDGSPNALRALLTLEAPTGIYSLEIFTIEFCSALLEELAHFEASGLPVSRPNSMNNYGVILDHIGFTPFLSELRERYLLPLTALLFPAQGGATLDSHHGFMVQYRMSEDLDLGFHYDDSEVTLNVCLGRQFKGGDLYFHGLLFDPATHNERFTFAHQPGRAILHLGKHRHGASAITEGERFNLILWLRSAEFRAANSVGGCSCGHSHDTHDEHEHEHEHEHEPTSESSSSAEE